MNVRQLKLITGEEILCDLVTSEFNEYDEEILFVKCAYSLVSTEDFENQVRFYTFRPFMMHQYETDKLLALNSGAVICAVIPDKKVIDQYALHIEQFKIEDEESDIDTDDENDDNPKDPNIVKFKPKLH